MRNSICALYNYNPLSRTREPDAEDNELEADLRRKPAEAAAINGEDILHCIKYRIDAGILFCSILLGEDGDLI